MDWLVAIGGWVATILGPKVLSDLYEAAKKRVKKKPPRKRR
jgi:hypothetical protein